MSETEAKILELEAQIAERSRRQGIAYDLFGRILRMYHSMANVAGGGAKGQLSGGSRGASVYFSDRCLGYSDEWFLPEVGGFPKKGFLETLREGSAVAIVANLLYYHVRPELFASDDGQLDQWYPQFVEKIYASGRLKKFPTAAKAVHAYFHDRDNFEAICAEVYSEYVLGYFKKIISGQWSISKE